MTGGTIRAVSSTKVRATLSAGTTANPAAVGVQANYAYGTGPAGFDTLISRTRTLSAGTSETIDLFTGTTLLDVFGHVTAIRSIKYIEVAITDGGDTSGLRVGGAASNCWVGFFADSTDKITTFPGGPSFRAGSPAGVAVTATTCNLKLENLGLETVEYTIVIGGATALGGAIMGVLGLTYP